MLLQEMDTLFSESRKEAIKIQHLVRRLVGNSTFADLAHAMKFYEKDLGYGQGVQRKAEYDGS